MALRGSLLGEQVIVQFGILDWEKCYERFGLRPASDIYIDEDKFIARVPWYLVQGLYKIYLAPVTSGHTQIGQCELVWEAQGNNPTAWKAYPKERSFSMGDIVSFSNGTVWVCVGSGWRCINPGVI